MTPTRTATILVVGTATATRTFTPTATPGVTRRYVLTVVGAPRNLRIGVVTKTIYMIKVTNARPTDTFNVIVTNTLPVSMEFTESIPPPTTLNGNVSTYTIPRLPAGATQMILIHAQLSANAQAGFALSNTTAVRDDQGNAAETTVVGGVRAGVVRHLTLDINVVRQTLSGSKVQYFFSINNPAAIDAQNVVLSADVPADTDFVSGLPSPSSMTGQRFTWNLGTVSGPGKASVRLIQRVHKDLPPGTVLTLSAILSDASGHTDQETATTTVRK